MKKADRIAVCSRSFSRNAVLREELLKRYEHVTFNEKGQHLCGNKLVEFLSGHDKAIIGLEKITNNVLCKLPRLKVISKYGVGLDMIDMAAMKRHGKRLGWFGGVNRRSVSELVISFAVAMLRHVPVAHREVLDGAWQQHVGGLLSGRTVGIIGCGFIGQDLIKLLQPWDCTLLVHDTRHFPEFYDAFQVRAVPLDELLSQSDVVTLHVPLDSSTKNILSKEKLRLMKSSAILINAARGGLVDENAMKSMLKTSRLAAAAFDVFNIEPPEDMELLSLPNFLVTPHIGGSAAEAIRAMGFASIDGLEKNTLISTPQ